MARGNWSQNSFLGGEWSPFSQGRSDQQAYYGALNLSLNYIPTDEGALVRRPGTRFSAHAKAHDGNIRLIPFVSESNESLICELTANRMRFHRFGTLLTELPAEVKTISSATPAVVETQSDHGYSTGDTIVFQSVGNFAGAPLFNKQFTITVLTSTTFSIAHTPPLSGDVDGSTLIGADAIGAIQVARVVEKSLPYGADELADIKYIEEGDRLFLFHPNHKPRILNRDGLTIYRQQFSFGPYPEINTTATTMALGATSGSTTLTASSTTGINDGQGFLSTDVNRFIAINTGTDTEPHWNNVRIDAVNSTTSVNVTIFDGAAANTNPTTNWRMQIFSETTGWPKAGAVHEARLWVVSDLYPGRIDASKTFGTNNLLTFDLWNPVEQDGTVADDNAIVAVLSGSGRQNVQWLQQVEQGLLLGTEGGEYIIRASSFDDPITPFSIQARLNTTFGASSAQPIRAGRNTVFTQNIDRGVIEYKQVASGIYDGSDIARVGRHLTEQGVRELAYSGEPMPIIWVLRGDGRLAGVTYRADAGGEQIAWHRHSVEFENDVTAGEDGEGRYLRGGGSRSTGNVLSIASAPFSDAEASRNDTLWLAVRRGSVVCVEYMMPVFDTTFLANEGFYVDSGNLYRQEDEGLTWELIDEATDTYRFYGLDRLNGKSVEGVFRGYDLGSATVTDGYVDFVVPDALQSADAAFETASVTQVAQGGVTFNSSVLSILDTEGATVTTSTPISPHQTFVKGEDGNLYYFPWWRGGDTNIWAVNVATGAVQFTLTTAQILTDANSVGATFPADPNNAMQRHFVFPVPESQYFYVVQSGQVSGYGINRVGHKILLYKINASGAPEIINGYAGVHSDLATRLGVEAGNMGGAFVMTASAFGQSSGSDSVYLKNPIVIAGNEDTSITDVGTSLVVVPSVNQFINLPGAIVEEFSGHWLPHRQLVNSTLTPPYDEDIANAGPQPDQTLSPPTFFLPAGDGKGVWCCFMPYKTTIDAHIAGTSTDSAFITAKSATHPDGFISALRLVDTSVPVGSPNQFGFEQKVAQINEDLHDRFVNSDGSPAFPFSDYSDRSDGTAGDPAQNYYLPPSVFASDVTNPDAPWYVFFPKVFGDVSSDYGYVRVKVFAWYPRETRAVLIDDKEGRLWTPGVEHPADRIPQSATVFWNRDNNDLIFLVRTQVDIQGTDYHFVAAKFGTFSPSTETVTVVAESHVDAIIGCGYKSRGQTLRPDFGAGAQNGPGLGKTRRVDQYAALLYKTQSLKFGTDFDTMFDANYGDPLVVVPDAQGRPPLFSGVAHGSLNSTYDFDNFISWEQDRPLPGAIIAVAGFSNVSDR